jgi:hypothetical protein
MVDFGWFSNKSYEQMISSILRPGDISTLVFRIPAPLLTLEGQPAPYMLEARKRGIKFDVGHGGGSFNFALAGPMVKSGFFPDSISTDLHVGSATGVMVHLRNVMSKMLVLGIPCPKSFGDPPRTLPRKSATPNSGRSLSAPAPTLPSSASSMATLATPTLWAGRSTAASAFWPE